MAGDPAFNLKNEMNSKFVFNYDEKNNNVETIEYDSLSNQRKIITNRFDQKNNLIERTEKDISGEPIKIIKYEYEYY